jgi:hypothetical protein
MNRNRSRRVLFPFFAFVVMFSVNVSGEDANCKPLGTLDRFWRFQPALGPFHEQGQGLIPIPDYVTSGTDFDYVRRDADQEPPFADHLSLVRLLGGFNNATDSEIDRRDLAYRDSAGNIGYRLELLEPRLRPYLDSGIQQFTLVLDNVPWCFPSQPSTASLGQKSPPRDPREWRDFIVAVCTEYVRIVGPEIAANTRFRIGTENNGRERFDGSHEEYLRHYQASAAAIQSVLPEAKIGPFNISGASIIGVEKRHNVRGFDLTRTLRHTPNPFNNAPSTPVDFISLSRYFSPGADLSANARGAGEVWDAFAERVPELSGISREVHEFGVAPFGEDKGGFVSSEDGALGAAATALMMFRLRAAGVDRVFHWPVVDVFRDANRKLQHLFTSTAWLLSVLERAAGGDAFLLQPQDPSSAATDYVGLVSVKIDESVFVFTAYNPDTTVSTQESVSFELPDAVATAATDSIRAVVLDRNNAVHDRIRRDLAAAGLLTERFVERPDRIGSVRQMGEGREAEVLVGERLETYHAAWQKSLSLRPISPQGIRIETRKGVRTLSLRLSPPQLVVLVVMR